MSSFASLLREYTRAILSEAIEAQPYDDYMDDEIHDAVDDIYFHFDAVSTKRFNYDQLEIFLNNKEKTFGDALVPFGLLHDMFLTATVYADVVDPNTYVPAMLIERKFDGKKITTKYMKNMYDSAVAIKKEFRPSDVPWALSILLKEFFKDIEDTTTPKSSSSSSKKVDKNGLREATNCLDAITAKFPTKVHFTKKQLATFLDDNYNSIKLKYCEPSTVKHLIIDFLDEAKIAEKEKKDNEYNFYFDFDPMGMSVGPEYYLSIYKDAIDPEIPDYEKFTLQYVTEVIIKVVKDFYAFLKKSEEPIEIENPEAPADAPLQKIAFGMNRKGKNVPRERNTDIEQRLYKILGAHFNDNQPFGPDVAKMIRSFMKEDIYEKTFSEPSASLVWRGMTVSDGWLRKALGKDIPTLKSGEIMQRCNFNYTPASGGSSSWTTSKQKAKDFSGKETPKRGQMLFNVVLEASVSDNPYVFVSGPKTSTGPGLYGVDGFDTHEDEKEAVGLGKVKVSAIMWKPTDMSMSSTVGISTETVFTKPTEREAKRVKDVLDKLNAKSIPEWEKLSVLKTNAGTKKKINTLEVPKKKKTKIY